MKSEQLGIITGLVSMLNEYKTENEKLKLENSLHSKKVDIIFKDKNQLKLFNNEQVNCNCVNNKSTSCNCWSKPQRTW